MPLQTDINRAAIEASQRVNSAQQKAAVPPYATLQAPKRRAVREAGQNGQKHFVPEDQKA
jgi:hypothetical protein